MEIAFMDHVRRSLLIDSNKDAIIDKLLSLTLEIICLLTGEDYVVVRKSRDAHMTEKRACRGSEVNGEARGLVTVATPPAAVTEENPARRIAGPAKNPHRDAEKLPIKSEDVQISTWDAVAVGGPEPRRSADSAPGHQRILERGVRGHQDSTEGVRGHQDSTDPKQDYISARLTIGSPSRRCRTPVSSQDCSTQDPQAEPPEDGMFHQECKEEEDMAIPEDIGSGGDDCTDHPERCRIPVRCEESSEEDNEAMTQDYQPDAGDGIFHPPCKEEVGSDYSGAAVSSLDAVVLRQCSQAQEHFPNPSDPAALHKSPYTSNLFSCSTCGIRFSSETTFAAHQRFHVEEKSYDCTYCGKSFNQRSRLLSHKRKHTGEKPFSCPVCGRCFAERSALVTHQRIHSGEKPFNCTECARSFVQRSSLVKHQRIHTGERPFVCSQCGRCFSQSSNLVRHQRILHQFL